MRPRVVGPGSRGLTTMRGAWLVAAALAITASACSGDDEAAGTPTTAAGTPTTADAGVITTTTSTTELSAVSVDCGPPMQPVPPGTHQVVNVFLICDNGVDLDLRAVPRVVPAGQEALTAAVAELLGGETPEEATLGFSSAFSSGTAKTLRSAVADGDTAVLDLTAGFAGTNNFSTSALSLMVMSQIEATVFQFPEIIGLDFRIEGERWCGWENPCDGAPNPLRNRRTFEAGKARRLAQAEAARIASTTGG